MESTNKANKLSRIVRAIPAEHRAKSLATILGMMLGLAGCAGFPIGSTVRLICATATGTMDLVDKFRQNQDSGTAIHSIDASANDGTP